MNQEPKVQKPNRFTKTKRALAGLTLAAGMSAGVVAAENGSNKPQATVSLSGEIKHPLSPLYTEASLNGMEVTPGQQPPVGEDVSVVPGHKDELKVQFGSEADGYTPPSEIVHGTLPDMQPGEESPLFNVGIPVADIRPTPGAPKTPPVNMGTAPVNSKTPPTPN